MGFLDGLDWLWDLLYPRRCASCGEVTADKQKLCEKCRNTMTVIEPPICSFCGHNEKQCICSIEKLTLPHLAAPFLYEGAVRKALHRFKFDGEKSLAAFFGEHMAQTAARETPIYEIDFVCCVPMTRAEQKSRHYNQSELLARETAKLLDLPLRPHAVEKICETVRQHTLGMAERLENPREAFSADNEAVNGKSVLLCDDIKTTGATLFDCCRALKLAGARDIYCLCAAVTCIEKD